MNPKPPKSSKSSVALSDHSDANKANDVTRSVSAFARLPLPALKFDLPASSH
jgi:hypothetical protein